jgi:hypothetical protein
LDGEIVKLIGCFNDFVAVFAERWPEEIGGNTCQAGQGGVEAFQL